MLLTRFSYAFFLAALTVLFCTSCSTPRPVSRLSLLGAEDAPWYFGRQRITKGSDDGIFVAVNFLESSSQYLAFDILVSNESEGSYLLDPLQFNLQGLAADRQTPQGELRTAIDPEAKITSIDEARAYEVAEASRTASLNLFSATLDVVDALVDKNETQEEKEQEQREREERWEEEEIEEFERQERLDNLAQDRDYWAFQTVRKTTIPPGYQLGGTIFFVRNDEVPFFELSFPIRNERYRILFEQKLSD